MGITGRNDGKIWEHSLIHSHARLLLRTASVRACVCVVWFMCAYQCERERLLPHQKAFSIFPRYADIIFVGTRKQVRLTPLQMISHFESKEQFYNFYI